MKSTLLMLLVAAMAAPAVAVAQRGSASGRVVERIDEAADETLFIVYSDGTRVAAPTEKDWKKQDGPTFYSEPKIAGDRQTIGWLVNYKNTSTSYDIPLSVMIVRDGKIVRTVGDGFMISEWHFLDGGREVVYTSGTVHGDAADHSTRVEIATGKVLANP